MAIPGDELQSPFIRRIFSPGSTVEEVLWHLAAADEPNNTFAVVGVAAGLYDALLLNDFREPFATLGAELLALPLGLVQGLLRPATPFLRADAGRARVRREQHERPRRRLVLIDEVGAVAGVLASPTLATTKGEDLLALLTNDVGRPSTPTLLVSFPQLSARGVLHVGSAYELRVAVEPVSALAGPGRARPFVFAFAEGERSASFVVAVDGDEEAWTIRALESTMVVGSPGVTTQPALFLVTPHLSAPPPLLVTVEQAQSRALVQKVWLSVESVAADRADPGPTQLRQAAMALPGDARGLHPTDVELTLISGADATSLLVQATLPEGVIRSKYRLRVSKAALQNAVYRLRQEIDNIVLWLGPASDPNPFMKPDSLDIDLALARRAYLALADVGWQIWDMLFRPANADEGLRRLTDDLRALPQGSRVRITLDDEEFIIPWALLYDQPGPLSEETLVWSGFWGYRYLIDVLPAGRFPYPAIREPSSAMLTLLSDDAALAAFTQGQEHVALGLFDQTSVVWGHDMVMQALSEPVSASVIYAYCYGQHLSGIVELGRLPSETAISFSQGRRLRLADLRRISSEPFGRRPLVFLNCCEGAAQDALYPDGFMPFFLHQKLARGLVSTEAKTPVYFAHDFALRFLEHFAAGRSVGEILWSLRRHYLDRHHNILGFNYSLYGHADVSLARGASRRRPIDEGKGL